MSGAAGSAGSSAPAADDGDSGGCGCRLADRTPASAGAWLVALGALAFMRRRKR